MENQTTSKLYTFWHLTKEEILLHFSVDQEKGLTKKQVALQKKLNRANKLYPKKHFKSIFLFLKQWNSPFIYLLLFCALISLILYDKTDAFIIFSIILVSSILSFFQERGACLAVEKLLQIVKTKTFVIREGCKKEVFLDEVVAGDIVTFSAGDLIPADCYILECTDLFVDEAALTGETFSSEKHISVLAKQTAIAKRTNSLFMGTHVVSGYAKAIAVLTGADTEFGKISRHLEKKIPETEFEKGIRKFGNLLLLVALYFLAGIFAINIYLNRPILEALLFSLAIAIGLTPQLLPAIISVNLSWGAKKMAQKKVIVKRLNSIENFGSMDVLFSDKTGTLTKGKILLNKAVSVLGYESLKVLQYAFINATSQTGYTNPIDEAICLQKPYIKNSWEKLDEIPYDFVRKKLSILIKIEKDTVIITKGAFQNILDICSYFDDGSDNISDILIQKENLKNLYLDYSNQGFRVLAVSYKKSSSSHISYSDENEMIFLGFLLFSDTPKENISQTVENLKNLGIELKIITGDNRFIAKNIATLLNLTHDKIITGSEISEISDEALAVLVNQRSIFAEIEPNQKEKIILASRKLNHVVGYIGDGINDITALHAADVSISVNTAVDAAKEVADIVLLDKELSVLLDGVIAGRMTFINTMKYIFMATSANFGNMFSMAGASIFLSFLPLLPKQVLLTNLMEDLPEMTIAMDNVDKQMIEKPRRWNIAFIKKFMIVFGLISSVFDFATFGILILLGATQEQFRTGWFMESVITASFIVLIVRTFGPFYKSSPSKILLSMVCLVIFITLLLPWIPYNDLLGFTQIPFHFYPFLFAIIVLYMTCVEVAKKIVYRKWLRNF